MSKAASHDKILEMQLSREGEQLKTEIFRRSPEEEETLRHYEEKTCDLSRINARCREIVRLLNNANLRGTLAGENFAKLRDTGFALFEELIPPFIQQELAGHSYETLIVNMDDGLVHIPWELIYDGKGFLCRRYNVGRIVRTRQQVIKPRSRNLSLPIKALILCDPCGDLPNAYAEGDRIRKELDESALVVHADLFNRSVDREMLREYLRHYDMIHYAGHADYDAAEPAESGWLVKDGKWTSLDILSLSRNLPLPALIFSNACQSGQTAEWVLDEGFENRLFGLAHAFLVSGVQHYIGTFWEVLDEVSCEFSIAFYHNLVKGLPIGSAVRKARQHLIEKYTEDNIIWASYVLYGHPGFAYFQTKQEKPHAVAAAQRSVHEPWDMPLSDATRSPAGTGRRFGMRTGVLAAVLLGLLVLFFARKEMLQTISPPEQTVTESAPASSRPAADIKRVMDVLSARYAVQQQGVRPAAEEDSWTSRPLSMSLAGFSGVGRLRDRQELELFFTANLSSELARCRRISLVERERLAELLEELSLSTSDIAEHDAAMVMLGRLMGARLIAAGKIIDIKGSAEVSLRIFETASSRLVVSLREPTTQKSVREVTQKLARATVDALSEQYPIRGRIGALSGEGLMLNVGSDVGVEGGGVYRVFAEQDPVVADGKVLGYDDRRIGTIRVTRVDRTVAYAAVSEEAEPFQIGMRVIEE